MQKRQLASNTKPGVNSTQENVQTDVPPSIQISGQEASLFSLVVRRQAAHLRGSDNVIQEVEQGRDRSRNGYLVLPLELGPHCSEYFVGAGGGSDVVHDVHVNVVQVDVTLFSRRSVLVHDSSENVPRFGRAHLNGRANGNLIERADRVRLRSLYNLHVAHSGEFDGKVGKGVGCSIQDQDLKHNVVVVDGDKGFGVHGVSEST
jgi:hypothetical protein